MAVVAAGELRQVADPNRPADRAFESPLHAGERVLRPLGESAHVMIVGGPTSPNGAEYWQIADRAFPGCCAPFGWVPAMQTSGESALEPFELNCPAPGATVSGDDIYELGVLEAASCYGDAEFTMRGLVTCGRPVVDTFLTIAGPAWANDPTLCAIDRALPLYGPAVTNLFDATGNGAEFDATVELSAHFNDPSSAACRWAPATSLSIDVPDDAPVDTAQFACRTSIYVTTATPEPTPVSVNL
jgi:hypothetical protein